jgi:hypothetical protein
MLTTQNMDGDQTPGTFPSTFSVIFFYILTTMEALTYYVSFAGREENDFKN